MNFRMILNNFQQTKFADITFSEGLTIIKGTNNQGKSSLRRALEAVIFNNPRKTKSYIMNGTKSCSVEIHIDGYKSILWTKTDKECTYKIGDDEPIQKAGRLSLKDVYPDHPFTLFGDNLLFNIIKQGGTPIPFGQSSSQVFTIFEDLYGILSTKEDIAKFNTEMSEYNNQIVQNTRQLEKLNNKLIVIKDFKKSVNREKLIGLQHKLKCISDTIDSIKSVKDCKSTLDTHKVIKVSIEPKEFLNIVQTLRKIKEIKSIQETISEKPVLVPPVDIKNDYEDYLKLQKVINIDNRLLELENKRVKVQKEIQETRKLIPVCPTCKRPF